MRRVWGVGIAAVVTLALVSCSSGTTERVNVAAAADLRYALNEIITLAQDANPETEFAVTYGSSGQFLQQIVNGAPFDLYLSADEAFPQQLVDEGLATDPFPYAIGRLVLWVPEASSLDPRDGLSVLADARRIAIANPEHAPYGRAAVSAMETAGIYDEVSNRLVLGENVAQAAEFVMTGNADAGVVALSLVLSDPLRDVGEWWEIPVNTFPAIAQGGALITDSSGARLLRDIITGPAGRDVLARYGFTLPEA
ncbi:MAG: molybdate ABC transporter substrate-binding protein [Candidatus Nanopelagicales bacterium]